MQNQPSFKTRAKRVRRSQTAIDGPQTLLAQALPKSGFDVIAGKPQILDRTIDT